MDVVDGIPLQPEDEVDNFDNFELATLRHSIKARKPKPSAPPAEEAIPLNA